MLQERAKLSKYYTQNIDGLERLAGVHDKNMVEAHGTFHSAACVLCKEPHPIEDYKKSIYQDIIPTCKACQGFIKPNIVFFGEQLPTRFFDEAEIDCVFCDLLICIGTSLEVYPFAGKDGLLLGSVPCTIHPLLLQDLLTCPSTSLDDCSSTTTLLAPLEVVPTTLFFWATLSKMWSHSATS